MKLTLEWEELFDDSDNSYWEAPSIYSSEGGPDAVPDIYWRLRQRLWDNKIEWYEDHDAELLFIDIPPKSWNSLKEAKKEIKKKHVETTRNDTLQKGNI